MLHRLLESADSPCRPEAAALAPPPAPLVRAALDIVRTYVHNQSERGVDGLASVSATTAALKADMVTFAASGASRIPPGAAGASLGLRPAAEAALEEVALLDPQHSLGSVRNVATRAACRLMEVKSSRHTCRCQQVWLLKPSYGSKGAGMRLFNDGLARVAAEGRTQRVGDEGVSRDPPRSALPEPCRTPPRL